MRHITSGLLGLGISIACLLPPIMHFVTGPLGPAIGGFAGSFRNKGKADTKAILIIGSSIGTGLALIFVLLGAIIFSAQLISLPQSVSGYSLPQSVDMGTLLQVTFLLFAYGTSLGSLGAWLGNRVNQKA